MATDLIDILIILHDKTTAAVDQEKSYNEIIANIKKA